MCRSVWNYALGELKDWSAARQCPVNACSLPREYIMSADAPYPNYYKQARSLTQAKQTNAWLRSVNAQVLQQVLKTLDRAHADMKKKGFGFPRFKQPNRMRSFVFPQLGKHPLGEGVVKLPSLGQVKFRQSSPYPDGFTVKQSRVVKRTSGFYLLLSFQSDVWHRCECGCSVPRDVASGMVIKKRAVGRTVYENACRDGLTRATATAAV